ncbi:MAG: hypothetical protein NVSMB2_09420 [Chloroflexota bacterium]
MCVNEPEVARRARHCWETFMRSTFARLAAVPAAAALLATQLAMPALAEPGQFTLVNNTSFPIASLYVGNSESDSWGDDILSGQLIDPTESGTVTLYNYDGTTCLYDVAVLGTEGQKGVMYRFDVCNLDTLTFSDK